MIEIDHEKEVDRYLNNSMTSKEIISFLQHVTNCSICSSKLEQLEDSENNENYPHKLSHRKLYKLFSMAKWIVIATGGILLFTLFWWLILYFTSR